MFTPTDPDMYWGIDPRLLYPHHPEKMMRKLWLVSAISATAVLVLGLHAWELFKIQTLRAALENSRWDRMSESLAKQDAVTPNVGTIQFIKGTAFSVEFQKVDYTANGLYLKGYIGNATNLYLTNLALTFTATKQIYEMRSDFDKADEKSRDVFAWFGAPSMGNAQAPAITVLPPGSRQAFEVTIPNVKQTSNGVRIVVEFSGERYSYIP